MNFQLDADMVKTNIEEKLLRHFGALPGTATKEQVFKAVAMTVRDILTRKRGEFKHVANLNGAKRVYYLCMEFMLGRSLRTNLCNLGLSGIYSEVLGKLGFDIEEIYDTSPTLGLAAVARAATPALTSTSFFRHRLQSATNTGFSGKNNRRIQMAQTSGFFKEGSAYPAQIGPL